MTQLDYLSIAEASRLIRKHDLSPVEFTEALLARIAALDPVYHAYIAVTADSKFVYTLNSVAGAVGIFAVQKDGTLLNIGFAGGVSPLSGFNGIAAF